MKTPLDQIVSAMPLRREIDRKFFQPWTEALERDIPIKWEEFPEALEISISFAAASAREPIRNEAGNVAGMIMRRQKTEET